MTHQIPRHSADSRGDAIVDVVREFSHLHSLSRREAEVLAMSARGISRKEAAFRLGCSVGSVDTYWRRMLKKTLSESPSQVIASLLSLALERRTNEQ